MDLKLVPSQYNGYFSPQDPGTLEEKSHRLSVKDEEAWIMSEFFKGLVVLEIGTGLGVSTRAIADKAKFVHTVDIDPWVEELVVPTLPDNVKFYRSVPKTLEVDGAFIDGLHSYNHTKQDILTCKKFVKKDGIILVHDLYIEGVNYALADFKPYVHIRTKAGMGLLWNS